MSHGFARIYTDRALTLGETGHLCLAVPISYIGPSSDLDDKAVAQ